MGPLVVQGVNDVNCAVFDEEPASQVGQVGDQNSYVLKVEEDKYEFFASLSNFCMRKCLTIVKLSIFISFFKVFNRNFEKRREK